MAKSMKEFLTIWLGEESASKMYEVLKKLPDGCGVQLHNTGSNNAVLCISKAWTRLILERMFTVSMSVS